MKIKILLLLALSISPSYCMKRVDSIDSYTIKNILSVHEHEVLPQVDTLKEAFSLAQASIKSELEFWDDIKEQMLEEHPRLKTIVVIMEKNKLSFKIRDRLFSYERKDSDTDEEYLRQKENKEVDFYMYNAYENLASISKYIIKLQKIIITAEKKEVTQVKIPLKFQEVKSHLSAEFAKLINECETFRSVFTTSTVKAFNKVLQANKNNNNLSLDVDVAIRDLSTIILPAFEGPKNILTVLPPKKTKSKKRKDARLRETGKDSSIIAEESVKASVITPTSADNPLPENNLIALQPNEQISLAATPVKEEAKLKLIKTPQMAVGAEEDISEDPSPSKPTVTPIEISSIYQPYQKTKESKIMPSVEREGPQLSYDQKVTIETILGLKKEYAQRSVSMSDFINVIEALNGHVVRKKKNVHFILPSWKNDGKWFSKAMHPLHKDNKVNIPRNTKYYWDRAKNLLLEANVEALL